MGGEARSIINQCNIDVATLVAKVPDADLVSLIQLLASSFKCFDARAPYSNWGFIPMVCTRVSTALDLARVSPDEALARAAVSGSELGRVMMAVSTLATSTGTGARTESAHGDAARQAAEAAATDRSVMEGVLAAQRLVQAGGCEADDMPELREKVRKLELQSPDVALLLHQEKMESAPSGMPSAAQRVWVALREIRTALISARTSLWREMAPEGFPLAAVLIKLNYSALSAEVLLGKNPAGGAAAALAKYWPMIVEMYREVWPRDGSAPSTLLRMANEALSVGGGSAVAIAIAVDGVFAEVNTRCAAWLRGIGGAPELKAAHTKAMKLAAQKASLKGAVAASTPRQSTPGKSEEQKTKEAAAKAAAAAAAQARAEGLEDTPSKKALKRAAAKAARDAKESEEAAKAGTAAGAAPAAAPAPAPATAAAQPKGKGGASE